MGQTLQGSAPLLLIPILTLPCAMYATAVSLNRHVLASLSLAALVAAIPIGVGLGRTRAEPSAPTFVGAHEQPSLPPSTAALVAPPAASPNPGQQTRADKDFARDYRSPLAGGLLTFPPSFASADGRYNLVIHFNGNTDLVEESYGYAGVNAVVMILNLGRGSGLYEDRFAHAAAFRLILARVQNVMEQRGLKDARLDRVALSAWSSGYGGVIKLLQQDELFDSIDAIVLFDAIHCGVNAWDKRLKADQIDPIRRFAKKAIEGRALLSIAHSEIATYGYENARKTTDAILDHVGVLRTPTNVEPPMPKLTSMVGVLPKADMRPLPPLTQAHRGELHVHGYSGTGPITHMLHLVQMSTTALPDLVRYWKRQGM